MPELLNKIRDLTFFDRRSTNGARDVTAALEHSNGARPVPPLPDLLVADAEGPDPLVEPDPAGGLHAITRTTNHWFERRAGALEQRAGVEADVWAKAGLPLSETHRTEPLDIEVVLASHARQIYRDWAERVQTKVRDAISRGTRTVGEHVGELRARVSRLDEIGQDLRSREDKIERIRSESARDTAPVRYLRLVSGWLFWPMAVLLVMVEFAANFPVFRLLLPMETVLAKAARQAADNVDESSAWAGVKLFLASLGMHVEATIVALVVVVGLVVFGKYLGASVRPLFALSKREHPLAAESIRTYKHQHFVITVFTAIGLSAILLFLFNSRGSIAAIADARVVADSSKRVDREARLARAIAAGDRAAIAQLTGELKDLADEELVHGDDAAYARTIQSNNQAILYLNMGLILVAATLGYGHAKDDLSDRRGEHPDLAPLRDKCAELRRERITQVGEAQAALTRAAAMEGAVRHLASSEPLAGWESKAKRLNAVIPRFRAENARLRGIDPATVRAFDVEVPLDLPAISAIDGFPVPPEMQRFIAEREDLAQRLAAHRVLTDDEVATRGKVA